MFADAAVVNLRRQTHLRQPLCKFVQEADISLRGLGQGLLGHDERAELELTAGTGRGRAGQPGKSEQREEAEALAHLWILVRREGKCQRVEIRDIESI